MKVVDTSDVDSELNAWGLDYAGDHPGVLVFAPGSEAASSSPIALDSEGRLHAAWADLAGLGNGVWAADIASAGAQRVRVRRAGVWFERARLDLGLTSVELPPGTFTFHQSEVAASPDPAVSTGGTLEEQAAQAQADHVARLFPPGWSTEGFTRTRWIGDRLLVVRADRGGPAGPWAATAWLWSTSGTNSIDVPDEGSVTVGDIDRYANGASQVVARPAGGREHLMAALLVDDSEGGVGASKVVVLAPEGTTLIRVGSESYPVQNRIAVIDESWVVGPGDTLVAEDAGGAELGRARLGTPSDVDGLLVPPAG
jgi:hypothetical protein